MLDLNPTEITALYEDHMGSDLSVCNAAKVSFGRRSKEMGKNEERLIQFLARGMTTNDFDGLLLEAHEAMDPYTYGDPTDLVYVLNKWRGTPLHRSPFNHVFASFWCQAPIMSARQLGKSEYMPWNEMSGRYIEFKPHFYLPDEIRSKVKDKKQGSGEPLGPQDHETATRLFNDAHQAAYNTYQHLLKQGVCEEQARGVLPLNTMTQWIWSGSLGAIAKMCQLRTAPDAQYESRVLAEQISTKMGELFPVSWKALMTYGVGE